MIRVHSTDDHLKISSFKRLSGLWLNVMYVRLLRAMPIITPQLLHLLEENVCHGNEYFNVYSDVDVRIYL